MFPPARAVPVVLCIAGFDPCGGAGLLADARACAAFDVYALGVQSALVPQNTRGVAGSAPTSPEFLRLQLQTLSEDIPFDAVKIGLLPNVISVEIVSDFLRAQRNLREFPLVIDPVLAPTRGVGWGDDATMNALRNLLFPLATLITPNALEAQVLTGMAIGKVSDMEEAARQIQSASGARGVLVKGGHVGETREIADVLFENQRLHILRGPRLNVGEVRGTGCLLSSAIAAQLAAGAPSLEATKRARSWLARQIGEAQMLGSGARIAVF